MTRRLSRLVMVCLILWLAATLFANERPDSTRRAENIGQFEWTPGSLTFYKFGNRAATSVTAGNGKRATPLYEPVYGATLRRYPTQADYPDWDRGYDGRGIVVLQNGVAYRSDYAIGIQSGPIYGGGCFPSVAGDETSPCLTETDSAGNQSTVWKERERWVFRMSYIDPSDPNAVEVRVGFPGPYGSFIGDDELVWVRQTSAGRSCFTFYSYYCNTYGIDLNDILDSVRAFAPSCSNKVGKGYRASIFYQYSRYKITDTIPPGVNEWEPATTPATATRLEKPGKEIWFRDWSLAPSENAISVGSAGIINPSVPLRYIDNSNPNMTLVGGDAVLAILPGKTKLAVRTTDCGVNFGNVSFTGAIDYLEKSGGHLHLISGDTSPGSAVSNAPPSFSGVTDANGSWESPFEIVAGQFAGSYEIKVKTNNILGSSGGGSAIPMESKTSGLNVGFRRLWRFIPGPSDTGLKLTGDDFAAGVCETQDCDNHKGLSHYALLEMHEFVRALPGVFQNFVGPGRIGINDMSLPFGGAFDIAGGWSTNSHISHRAGYDVDVDMQVYKADGSLDHATTAAEKEKFIKAVEKVLNGRRVWEPTIHFRLSGDSIDRLIGEGL